MTIREHQILVDRTARFYQLGSFGLRTGAKRASADVPDPDGQVRERQEEGVELSSSHGQEGRPEVHQLWFVCHGYRQLASLFIRSFIGLEEMGAVVVAPEGLSRFYIDSAPGRHGPEQRVGASWMTRVDRENEIRDYVAYLDAVATRVLSSAGSIRPKVVMLGFSQGVHTVARWASLGQTEVDEIVLWGACLPTDVTVSGRLVRARVTTVFGNSDPTVEPELIQDQDERFAAAGVKPRKLEYVGGHRVEPEAIRELTESFG